MQNKTSPYYELVSPIVTKGAINLTSPDVEDRKVQIVTPVLKTYCDTIFGEVAKQINIPKYVTDADKVMMFDNYLNAPSSPGANWTSSEIVPAVIAFEEFMHH